MKNNTALLGTWIRRFLLEYLIRDKNFAPNTQRSYRDTLVLLLPYVATLACKSIERLLVEDVVAEYIRAFLQHLEEERNCAISTRNHRLAAIHSLASFICLNNPEYIQWAGEVKAIPFKKTNRSLVVYLEKDEMNALLDATEDDNQRYRDHAILLFLYNTGARADETAHVQINDLHLGAVHKRELSWVNICGKGNKLRRCPLWNKTVDELLPLIGNRDHDDTVFLNRYQHSLTRYGIYGLVKKYASKASAKIPSLKNKQVSPHTIRHTTATHLLRSGVDINTIRAWLGHVSLATTNIYAHVDFEAKAKALANCEIKTATSKILWQENPTLMDFLRNL